MDIEFRDPGHGGPGGGRRGAWIERLTPLIDHPTRWAVVASFADAGTARSTASNLRKAIKVPPGRWEFAARKMPDGGGEVFARYLGPDLSAAEAS